MSEETGKYHITQEFATSMLEWFKDGKALPRRYVWEIVLGAYELFKAEESLVDIRLDDGMTCDVIGDVHGEFIEVLWHSERLPDAFSQGQYFDLLHLYSMTGQPSERHCLLMNGDLVDRGSWSMEVILTAFAYKCAHPSFKLACQIADTSTI